MSSMMTGIRQLRKTLTTSRRFCTSNTKTGAKESPKETTGEGSTYRGPITFASLAFAAVAGAGVITYYELEKEKKVLRVASEIVTTGKPALGGPWVLIDQNGVPRTDASYKGDFALLYFGFTYCPDICPSELVKVGKIIDGLASKKIPRVVKPIFISVDPARDTVGQIRHYAKDFHESFVFLTGTKDMVAAASKAYRVYFSKANEHLDDEEDYLVDHSIVLYLVDKEGEFVDFFTQRAQIGDVVEKIDQHMKAYDIAAPERAKIAVAAK